MADSKSSQSQTKASPVTQSTKELPIKPSNTNTNKLETITNIPNENKPVLCDYNNNQIINSNNNQPMPVQNVNTADTSTISNMQTYPNRYLQPILNSNIPYQQQLQQLNSMHVEALNGSINNIAYSGDMYTNGYPNTYQNINNTINNSYKSSNYYKMNDYSSNLNVSINEPIESKYIQTNYADLNNNINKQNNLNGLLNVVHSVTYNGMPNMQTIASNNDCKKQSLSTQLNQAPYMPNLNEHKHEITKVNNRKSQNNQMFETYLNSICRNCFNSPKLFCKCNVSKLALKKLYKNYTSFNSVEANIEPHRHHHHQADLQTSPSVSSSISSQLKRSPQIETNKKNFEKSKSDLISKSNNYVVNNERFVHYENVDSNTEKIFEML